MGIYGTLPKVETTLSLLNITNRKSKASIWKSIKAPEFQLHLFQTIHLFCTSLEERGFPDEGLHSLLIEMKQKGILSTSCQKRWRKELEEATLVYGPGSVLFCENNGRLAQMVYISLVLMKIHSW